MDMNLIGVEAPPGLLIVANSGAWAFDQVLEFFGSQIRNQNTRTAYLGAAREFFAWAEQHGVSVLTDV
ncbi:MAG TPA: hypothetical protein VIL30_15880, partial [Ramlibacter sp.]